MEFKKPLTAALLTGGPIVGGFGTASIASAQYGGDTPAPTDTTAEANGVTMQNIQLEDENAPAEGEDKGRQGRRGGHGKGNRAEAIAEAIGITVDELRAGRDADMSLADIAEANGSSADALVDVLVANVTGKLNAKVAAGELTEEEAAEKLADEAERIEEKVDTIPSERAERAPRGERGVDQDPAGDDA